MRIVQREVKPSVRPAEAFMAQRGQENGSQRLRKEVQALLQSGKAHTTTVAKVFELICHDSYDRITKQDVERVLPGFTAS